MVRSEGQAIGVQRTKNGDASKRQLQNEQTGEMELSVSPFRMERGRSQGANVSQLKHTQLLGKK